MKKQNPNLPSPSKDDLGMKLGRLGVTFYDVS
jgi:hypothetical protein